MAVTGVAATGAPAGTFSILMVFPYGTGGKEYNHRQHRNDNDASHGTLLSIHHTFMAAFRDSSCVEGSEPLRNNK